MEKQTVKKVKKSPLNQIPKEIIQDIICFLELKHVIKLTEINKDWNETCLSDVYWKDATKKNFNDLIDSKDTSISYYSFFKETWLLKNITNNIFEKSKTNTKLFGELKPVYRINFEFIAFDHGRDIIFYNEAIFFCFKDIIYSVSTQNFEVIWKKEYKLLRSLQFDPLTNTFITISNQRSLIFLTTQGREIKKIEFKTEELVKDIQLISGRIYVYSVIKEDYEAFLYVYSPDGTLIWSMPFDYLSDQNIDIVSHEKKLFIHNKPNELDKEFLLSWVELNNDQSPENINRMRMEKKNFKNLMFVENEICLTFENFNGIELIKKDLYIRNTKEIDFEDHKSVLHFNNLQTKEIYEFAQCSEELTLKIYDQSFKKEKSIYKYKVKEQIISVFFIQDDKFIIVSESDILSKTKSVYFKVFSIKSKTPEYENEVKNPFNTSEVIDLKIQIQNGLVVLRCLDEIVILKPN